MNEFHEFPKWKYHATEAACVVESKDAEAALGPGWFNSPADVAAQAESESPAEVLAEIEAIIHPKQKLIRKAKV